MNIIITMAGKSQRFKDCGYKIPKYMLSLGKKTIIENLVNCFSAEDTYHFIISKSQLDEVDNLRNSLKVLVKNSFVHVIDDHNFGPAYSVQKIKSQISSGPILITYCDFLVQWDYKSFVSFAKYWDAVIPTFIGFHPATYGDTLFAYIRRDVNGRILELKEKACFTHDRTTEPASVGIYYFNSFDIFLKYSEMVIMDKMRELPEAYVSLLANPMVEDGLSVATFDVKKFICLGTPKDYEEFLYWDKVINEPALDISSIDTEYLTEVNLIPMAGSGSRFKKDGFNTPKPLLTWNGAPLVVHASRSMPKAGRSIYIARLNELQSNRVLKNLLEINIEQQLINLEYKTNGQLDTCLAANEYIDDLESVFMTSCDYSVKYDPKSWESFMKTEKCDVVVWVNRLGSMPVRSYDAFGYCDLDKNDMVTNIKEKQTLSSEPWKDAMIVGSFWFREWKMIKLIEEKVKSKGPYFAASENYIGANINYLIDLGYRVKCFWVDEWISYGDPFEYEMLHYWAEYFENLD